MVMCLAVLVVALLLLHHINFYLWYGCVYWYYYTSGGSSLPHLCVSCIYDGVIHSPHLFGGDIYYVAMLLFSYAVPPSSVLLTYYVVSIYFLLSSNIALLRLTFGFQVRFTQPQILIYRLYLFINFILIVENTYMAVFNYITTSNYA